jgi:hypothetical protein
VQKLSSNKEQNRNTHFVEVKERIVKKLVKHTMAVYIVTIYSKHLIQKDCCHHLELN